MKLSKCSEISTTPYTFAAITHTIIKNGLNSVSCDISYDDYNIDVTKIDSLMIERTFEEVGRRIGTQFKTMEECVKWQNTVKPHRGLNYKRPVEVFFNRLQSERIFWTVKGGL